MSHTPRKPHVQGRLVGTHLAVTAGEDGTEVAWGWGRVPWKESPSRPGAAALREVSTSSSLCPWRGPGSLPCRPHSTASGPPLEACGG